MPAFTISDANTVSGHEFLGHTGTRSASIASNHPYSFAVVTGTRNLSFGLNAMRACFRSLSRYWLFERNSTAGRFALALALALALMPVEGDNDEADCDDDDDDDDDDDGDGDSDDRVDDNDIDGAAAGGGEPAIATAADLPKTGNLISFESFVCDDRRTAGDVDAGGAVDCDCDCDCDCGCGEVLVATAAVASDISGLDFE